LTLSAANAVQAGNSALQPIDETVSAVQLATFVSFYLASNGGNSLILYCTVATATGTASFVDTDHNGKLGVGERLTIDHPSCIGVSRKIVVDVTAIDANAGTLDGYVQLTLDAEPALHLQGTAAIGVKFFAGTDHFQWTVSNVRLDASRAGVADGTFTGEAVALLGGRSSSVLIARPRALTVVPTIAPSGLAPALQYSVNFSGTLQSSKLNGSVSFATQPPFEGTSGEFPRTGALVLTAGASKARFGPSADSRLVEEFADYQVDAAGTGYGAAAPAEWRSLLRGESFGWAPLRRPQIRGNKILPETPHVDDRLVASFEVLNPASGSVEQTFEWRRNGVPIPGEIGAQLKPGTFAHGDLIEVTVHVRNTYASDVDTVATTILNSAPRVAIELSPTSPSTTDEIAVTEHVTDVDGDPLQITREWRRNGVLVIGETGATFPASAQQKNDFIEATVIARDAASSGSATASATIVDAPPRVTMTSAPATVTHGMPMTFDARIEDDDGDPVGFRFKLAYGPAGMTVDPASGRVEWTPSGPMFDKTMTVKWGIESDVPTVQLGSGSLEVQDPNRPYPLYRSPFNTGTALRIGDFDHDGKAEMLLLGRGPSELERSGADYQMSWAYPFPISPTANPTAFATGDVDRDGRDEIFVASDTIVKLDGVERRPVASFDLGAPAHRLCVDLEYADLDRDGAPEVVCLATLDSSQTIATLYVLRAADLSLVWQSPEQDFGRSLAIGDVDGDAALEIVTNRGLVIDGATFATERTYAAGFGGSVAAGDVDGNGVAEIFGGGALFSAAAGSVSVLTQVPGPVSSAEIVDVTGDGIADLLTVTDRRIVAYRYNPGPKTTTVVFSLDTGQSSIGPIAAGDVDHDGKIEIVWIGNQSGPVPARGLFVAGSAPDAIEWSSPENVQQFSGGDLVRAPLAGPELLFIGTSRGGQILTTMDPTTGQLARSDPVGETFAVGAVDVADYDLDGTIEALLPTADAADYHVTAYDVFAGRTEWSFTTEQGDTPPELIAHGDLTGDGRDDVAALTIQGMLYAFDPAHQTLWRRPGQVIPFAAGLAITDLDGDGVREIVAGTSNAILVYARDGTGLSYTERARYSSQDTIVDLEVGDSDGDGSDDIFALTSPNSFNGSKQIVHLGPDLSWRGSFRPAFDAETIAIEPSPFARKNLVLSTYRETFFGRRGQLVTVDATWGDEVSRSPALLVEANRDGVHYLDVAGDGRLRLSLTDSFGMLITR